MLHKNIEEGQKLSITVNGEEKEGIVIEVNKDHLWTWNEKTNKKQLINEWDIDFVKFVHEPEEDFITHVIVAMNHNKKLLVSPSMANVNTTSELEQLVKEICKEVNEDPVIDLDGFNYKFRYTPIGNSFVIEEYKTKNIN